MKNRFCFLGLVLLMLLLMLPSAFAVNMPREYFETIAALSQKYGYYMDWSLEPKLEWMNALQTYGPADDAQRAADILKADKTDASHVKQIDDWLLQKYGTGGRLESIGLGSVMEVELGPEFLWPLDTRAWQTQMMLRYFPANWDVGISQIPNDTAITPEEAVSIARKAIGEVYGSSSDLSWDKYGVRIEFSVPRVNAADYDPFYFISFGLPAVDSFTGRPSYSTEYICYITKEGQVMDTSYFSFTQSPAEEKADRDNTGVTLDLDPDLKVYEFGGWSLDEKAAFSQEWMPFMERYMKGHLEYRGPYYLETQHLYGLPQDNGISQSDALKAAQTTALEKLHATEEELARCGVHYYYDITDAKRPLWKVYLSTLFSYNWKYGDSMGYFVVIDAIEGGLVDAYVRTEQTEAYLFR